MSNPFAKFSEQNLVSDWYLNLIPTSKIDGIESSSLQKKIMKNLETVAIYKHTTIYYAHFT